MESGEATDESDEWNADTYLCNHVLQVYYKESENALKYLREVGNDKIAPSVKVALIRRWEQIKYLIRSAFENGINPRVQAHMYKIFDKP